MRAPQGCSRKRQLLGPGCARARGVCACVQAARGGVEHTHYCLPMWMRARHCGPSASERWSQAIAQQHNTGAGFTTGLLLTVDTRRATRRR